MASRTYDGGAGGQLQPAVAAGGRGLKLRTRNVFSMLVTRDTSHESSGELKVIACCQRGSSGGWGGAGRAPKGGVRTVAPNGCGIAEGNGRGGFELKTRRCAPRTFHSYY